MTYSYKMKFGDRCRYTSFGLINKSRGMYKGGYDYYVYGIRGIISFEVLKAWGEFKDMDI